MRIRLYKRNIYIRNGKECLYRDIADDATFKTVEQAKERAQEIANFMREYKKDNPDMLEVRLQTGINFKLKDLDTKQVIEIFEVRF